MSIGVQDAESAIGFIGLGVMGEPMCRNLASKTGRRVFGYDISPAALDRLAAFGVQRATDIASLAASCDVIFLALPSGRHVEAVCSGPGGLLESVRAATLVVDLGTSPVDMTREMASRFARAGARYADAPIARTRKAAEDGTLSVMVGSDAATFAQLSPLLRAFASDVTHCGPVGAGQIVKILNNMVLVETVVALSGAVAVARRAGVDGKTLLETLSKGSADSFALRNHGLKAIVPGEFPERAFSTEYARKDLSYALTLGRQTGVELKSAMVADQLLEQACEAGYGALYWPVVSRIIDAAD